MLSVEELLYPRYKVIERWPDMGVSGYHAGQIITLMQKDNGKWSEVKRDLTTYEAFFQGYPHLFQRLEWWMERKGEETPEFIKSNNTIYRVDKWSKSYENIHWLGCYVNGNKKYIASEDLQPATEADYNTYLQTTNS